MALFGTALNAGPVGWLPLVRRKELLVADPRKAGRQKKRRSEQANFPITRDDFHVAAIFRGIPDKQFVPQNRWDRFDGIQTRLNTELRTCTYDISGGFAAMVHRDWPAFLEIDEDARSLLHDMVNPTDLNRTC